MPLLVAIALTLLSGCMREEEDTGPGSAGSVDTGPDLDPSPWTFEGSPVSTPELTTAELTAGLEGWLALVPTLDPAIGLHRWMDVLAQGDATCPAIDPAFAPQLYWEDPCTTADGVAFDGWALSFLAENTVQAGEECLVDGYYYGFAEVDGGTIDWASYGELRTRQCTNPAAEVATTDVTWRGDFGSTGGGWLDSGLTLELSGRFTSAPQGSAATLTGGMAGLPGRVVGVWFSGVTFAQPGVATGCTDEPSGSLTLFGDDGVAYDVGFGTTCDGCGDVTAAGTSLGTLCPDVSPVRDFEGYPWR